MPSCCNCFKTIGREFKSPMFDIVEPSYAAPSSSDGDGVTDSGNSHEVAMDMDVERTFSPQPRGSYLFGKVFLLAWSVAVMALSINNDRHQSFWLAKLTHWGVCFTVAYFIVSLVTAVYLAKNPPTNNNKYEIGLPAKGTWALLAIALPFELVVVVLFWALQYDGGELTYVSAMTHAVFFVLLFIDGCLLNRIPLRMKQFILYEVSSLLWVIWSVIHAYADVGNPYKDDGSQDDDAIYPSLRWKNNTTQSAILSVLVLFVANPILFMVCRALSRLPKRRLLESGGVNQQNNGKYEGGSFSNDEEAAQGAAAQVY